MDPGAPMDTAESAKVTRYLSRCYLTDPVHALLTDPEHFSLIFLWRRLNLKSVFNLTA